MKNNNHFFALVAMIIFSTGCYAQNDLNKANDFDRIALEVVIPGQVENIPEQARSLLESKLKEVAAQSGLGGEGIASRFALTAKMEVLSKDVVSTAPLMLAYSFDIYLYIVDNMERIILSSTSISIKGVGTNKNKAYTNGLHKINFENQAIQNFLGNGKDKIISYYNSKCDVIIAKAKALADQKQFQNAIFSLASIPEVCQDCYLKAISAIGPIYQKYIDYECASYINTAKSLFAANPNSTGALEAAEMISLISPDSKCFDNANDLIEKIENKMRNDENRKWNFRPDECGEL